MLYLVMDYNYSEDTAFELKSSKTQFERIVKESYLSK